MSHFIEKCKECQKVIGQCRCPDMNKEVRWSLCEKCKLSYANYGTTGTSLGMAGTIFIDTRKGVSNDLHT